MAAKIKYNISRVLKKVLVKIIGNDDNKPIAIVDNNIQGLKPDFCGNIFIIIKKDFLYYN